MSRRNISYIKLFEWFIVEEVREFLNLFGKKRLALFPVVILTFSFLLGVSIPVFDVESTTIGGIYHAVILLIGIQMGNIGFEARDRLDDVMGEGSRILYSSRTLPIKEKTLVSVFLVKDALFYAVVFLLPIVLGGSLGILLTPLQSSSFALNLGIIGFLSLYTTTSVAFILGVSIGFFVTTVDIKRTKGVIALILLFAIMSVAVSLTNIEISYITSLGTPVLLFVATILSLTISGIGILQFKLNSESPLEKEYDSTYTAMSDRFSTNNNYWNVLIKTLMDIMRSAGGFWKIVFSTGMIAITGYFLLSVVENFFLTNGYSQIAIASLFSLIAYPIYTIMFRYDSIDTYDYLPITEEEVYKSKAVLFMIMSTVVGIAFYTPIAYREAGFVPMFGYGILVLIGMLVYQLGILTVLVKDKPMQFLFDGMLFSGYSLSVMTIMIPAVIYGLYGGVLSPLALIGILAMNVTVGLVGLALTVARIRGYEFT
jgi:hypothetical protein